MTSRKPSAGWSAPPFGPKSGTIIPSGPAAAVAAGRILTAHRIRNRRGRVVVAGRRIGASHAAREFAAAVRIRSVDVVVAGIHIHAAVGLVGVTDPVVICVVVYKGSARTGLATGWDDTRRRQVQRG